MSQSALPSRVPLAAVTCLLALTCRVCTAEGLPREFFDAHCVDCHNAIEANADVRLDDVHLRDWSKHDTSVFFQRVLKVVRNGQMPPADAGEVSDVQRSAAAEALRSALMQHSGTGGTALRRLTRHEYENTVRKLFGIDYQTPPGFPTDNPAHGFDNTAAGLVVSPPLMQAYFRSAISIADQILPPPRKPVPSVRTTIAADDLVISYSSGAVIDGAMRLAARTDAMWRSATWPEKFEVRTAGTYRIKVSASRFAPPSGACIESTEPMKLEVRARSLNGKDGEAVSKQRLLAEFEVTEQSPEEFSCVAELHEAETPVFYFANAPVHGGDKEAFAAVLRKMFDNDSRLLAGWLKVEHRRGLRGGVGWDRVKKIRDSEDLDLSSVDMSKDAVDKLVKKMSSKLGLYAETVVYQFFEEGPALQIHQVDIEGPRKVIKTAEQKRQEEIARRFLGERGDRSDREYLRRFLRRFLTRAFRRPATEADIAQYTDMVMEHVGDGNEFRDGLHLAIRTALMSPKFLYRGHRPGRLDDFDLAARLSYFLTGGPPDEKLFAAAAAGELADPAELQQHARRLLASPELDRFVSDFAGQWLQTRRLEDIMPDARLFPEFTPEHREAMIAETELFFAEILRENLPLETFIQPGFTFLNKRLAESIYGREDVKKKDQSFVRVSLSPESPYGGLLGQAAVMMATANGVDTQPVVRGVWVLENVLGDPPPPPPDDVPALTPDTRNAKNVRELLAAHRSDASCANCHRRIDPIGFVLENFDPVGRWRTHYPVFAEDSEGEPAVEDGEAIDPTAEFPGGTEFQHVNDLKSHAVANIDDFAMCLSQKLLTYATGRRTTYADKQEIAQIVAAVREQGNGFQDLLLALVQSTAFATR